MSETSLKFGPEWLRALSHGGKVNTSPPSSPGPAKFKLADYRYGREEMLALFTKEFPPPDGVQHLGSLGIETTQEPLAFMPLNADEQRIWQRGLGNDTVLRGTGTGRGPANGMGRGRGNSLERGRGRGRGSGSGAPYYSRGLSYDEEADTRGLREIGPPGMGLGSRTKSFERSQSSSEGGRGWGERGPPPERGDDRSGAISPRKEQGRASTVSWRSSGPRNEEEGNRWRSLGGGNNRTDKWGNGRSSWRGQEEWDEGRGGSGNSRQSWDPDRERSSQRRHWEDEHLPEWAVETSEDKGGSFDSAGAFHNAISDDEDPRNGEVNPNQVNETVVEVPEPDGKMKVKGKEDFEWREKEVVEKTCELEGKRILCNTSVPSSSHQPQISSNQPVSMPPPPQPPSIPAVTNLTSSSSHYSIPSTHHPPTSSNYSNSLHHSSDSLHNSNSSRNSSHHQSSHSSQRHNTQHPAALPHPQNQDNRNSNNPQHNLQEIEPHNSSPPSSHQPSFRLPPTSRDEDNLSHMQSVADDLVAKLVEEDEHPSSTRECSQVLPPPPGGFEDPPQLEESHEEQWYYMDPQGDVQGLFSSADMGAWYKSGYFKNSLLLRRQCDDKFSQLGDLMKVFGRVPFLPGPKVPPLKVSELMNAQKAQAEREHYELMQAQLMQKQMYQQHVRQQVLQSLQKHEEWNNLTPAQQQQLYMQQMMQLPPMMMPTLPHSESNSHPMSNALMPEVPNRPRVPPLSGDNAILSGMPGIVDQRVPVHPIMPQTNNSIPITLPAMPPGGLISGPGSSTVPSSLSVSNSGGAPLASSSSSSQDPIQAFVAQMSAPHVPLSASGITSTPEDIPNSSTNSAPSPPSVGAENPLQKLLMQLCGNTVSSASSNVITSSASIGPINSLAGSDKGPEQFDAIQSLMNQLNLQMQSSDNSQEDQQRAAREENEQQAQLEAERKQFEAKKRLEDEKIRQHEIRMQAERQKEEEKRRELEERNLRLEQELRKIQENQISQKKEEGRKKSVQKSQNEQPQQQQQQQQLQQMQQQQQQQQKQQRQKQQKQEEEQRKKEEKRLKNEEKRLEEEKRKEEEENRKKVEMEKRKQEERRKKEEKERQKALQVQEEMRKAALEEERRRMQQLDNEERRLAEEEQKHILQQQQEIARQAAIANAASAPWLNSVKETPSLAEIQKTQEIKNRKEREVEAMRESHRQKEAAKQAAEDKKQKDLTIKWAAKTSQQQIKGNKGNGTNNSQPIKSLLEIQKEEERELRKQMEKEQSERAAAISQLSLNAASVWGAAQSLSWAGRASTGASQGSQQFNAALENNAHWSSTNSNMETASTVGFWDSPETVKASKASLSMHSPMKSVVANQKQNAISTSKGNKKKRDESDTVKKLFMENIAPPSDSFTAWCKIALSSMKFNATIDIPTFVGFLSEVESPYEVHDYIRSYLGDTREVKEFARQYLDKRSKARNAQKEKAHEDNILAPAPAVNPVINNEFQEVKSRVKKGKKKMQKVDNSFLGFNVASNERMNVEGN